MSGVHVFTSAAFNYIPKARLLFSALRRHHPEWTLHLALGDHLYPEFKLDNEPFDEIMPLAGLEIPHWRGWAFCHSIVELCTAIKPFALRQLLSLDNCRKVLYFDPDMVAFSRLDDLLEALDSANVLLTPHQVDPETTLEAVIDNEICSLRHGVYNLGFIGVKNSEEGRRFADWWASRVYHFCRDDIPNGLFTDQRWIDLVPAFFEGVAVMRSHRHNVATWNITTRNLCGCVETGFIVDGDQLGFYHFTGFDSGAHAVMAKKNARCSPAVFDLIRWYQEQTKNLGQDPLAQVRWAYDTFSNGEKISLAQRIVYRQRVDLQAAYPDPFDSAGYLQWWKTTAAVEYPELSQKGGTGRELPQIAPMLTIGFCAGMPPLQNRSLADFDLARPLPHSAFEVLAAGPAITDLNYLSIMEAARRRIAELEYGRREAQATIDAIYASASWQITAPVRYLSRLLVPRRIRAMVPLLNRRNMGIALRCIRRGQFKTLYRRTRSAVARRAPFDSARRRVAKATASLRRLSRHLVPSRIRPMVRLLNRRNVRTALRYIRLGQFKALRRHALCAVSRNAPADSLSLPTIPNLSKPQERRLLSQSTDIIIPVYNGMEFLPKLFDSMQKNTTSPYRLIIIDDASPDERIWPYLQTVSAKFSAIILLRNEENRGFVSTCNRAIELARGHFVICNTDIEVPPGWLERLLAPIYSEVNVATVTPFTNAGTICSFPIIVQDNEILNGWSVEAIDALFAQLAEPAAVNMPTGVGFCMAFNQLAVKEVGLFDERTFDRGYGEENDWCVRASARGYTHRMATNLYVYHKHGGSFDGKERARLTESNFRKLSIRYPEYQSIIEEFIRRDPAKAIRAFLLLYVVAHLAEQKTVLIVDHALGGGANLYREQLVQQYAAEGHPILLLTYEYHAKSMRLDFSFQEYKTYFTLASLGDLVRLTRIMHQL